MQAEFATPRLFLRTLRVGDAPALLAYERRNADHLRPWQPAAPADYFTLGYWERLVANSDTGPEPTRMRFAAFAPGSPDVVAIVNLNSIERGIQQVAVLGYSLDARAQGQGLGREAVGSVVEYAFDTLGLHRIEANYQPTNERSGKLLRAIGFAVEGYARDYLYINGAWRDHVLTSRTNPRSS